VIEALGSDGPDDAFRIGVGVRSPEWRSENLGAFGAKPRRSQGGWAVDKTPVTWTKSMLVPDHFPRCWFRFPTSCACKCPGQGNLRPVHGGLGIRAWSIGGSTAQEGRGSSWKAFSGDAGLTPRERACRLAPPEGCSSPGGPRLRPIDGSKHCRHVSRVCIACERRSPTRSPQSTCSCG